MPGDDLYQQLISDPDFIALDDAAKGRVMQRLKVTPPTQAEENPALGRAPGSSQDIRTDMSQAAALSSLAGMMQPRTAGMPSTRLASLVWRGSKEPAVGAARFGGDIDYARNAQLNRAALQRGGAASTGSVSGRAGPATGRVPLRAKVAGAASAEPAASVTRPASPTASTIWTPESSAQNTGMWHAGQGTMPNPEVQTPQNLRLLAKIKQLYMGQADPGEEAWRQMLREGERTGVGRDPRGRGY